MAARPGLKEAGNNSRDLLRGWCGYFGHCDDYWTLRDLDSWIRRRLRSLAWRAWRTPRKRFYELVRRGVDRNLAMRMIYFRTGSWDTSNSMAMSYAMPGRYLHECLKLISLLQARPTMTNRRVRTPVRTVVWEGSSRKARPYPDLGVALTPGSKLSCPHLLPSAALP